MGSAIRAAFPQQINLTEVIRQKDKLMVDAIHEISLGEVSNDTIHMINQLRRPLKEESIKLFATNDLVDDYNRDQILDFPGQLSEFKSTDTGDKKYLNDMLAAKKLWLKIGIPVILIKNLSDVLVNGLMGEVYDICDDGKILVEFPKMTEKIYVERIKFEVFDPRKNKVVAVREQFPLKPAYALTIHKSQGMTLERVEVDCRDIFKPGQLGVAIGRARSLDGLRVLNFKKSACIKQPEKIQRFLTLVDSTDTNEDRSCCNNHTRGQCSRQGVVTVHDVEELGNVFIDADDDLCPNTEDLEDDFNEIITNLDNGDCQQEKLPEDLDLNAILERLTSKKVLTPMQFETNKILSSIDKEKLKHFARNEFCKLKSIMDECHSTTTGQIVSKDLGSFYTKNSPTC